MYDECDAALSAPATHTMLAVVQAVDGNAIVYFNFDLVFFLTPVCVVTIIVVVEFLYGV